MARAGVRTGVIALCLSACAAAAWGYAHEAATQAAPHASTMPSAAAPATASNTAKATASASAAPATALPAAKGTVAKQAGKGVPKGVEKPYWAELNPAQQQALLPLAAEWDKQPRLPKKKWVDIANRFHALTPDEQQRVHERMREWIKLTPAQRTLARENYTRAKKIGGATRSEQWKQYQQLPEDQKRKLAAQEAAKKHLPVISSGTKGEPAPLPPIKPGAPPPAALPPAPSPAAPSPGSALQPANDDQRGISLGPLAPPNG